MNKIKIALDDGHGMETAGKRTPILPNGLHSETGNYMHENEFNRAVVSQLTEHLMRCGFEVLLVAPGDSDVPLKARTDLANREKADFYLSVHANAIGNGEFNSARGIETFHYITAMEASKRAADILHRYLMGGTRLPDRGVKSADFHVLRETKMPAVLVECAFMTNIEDAKLLLSDTYRAECAEELARGLCEFFNVFYVREALVLPSKLPTVQGIVNVLVDGKEIDDGYLIDGRTFVPLRAVGDALGIQVGWDAKTRTASLKGNYFS